MLRKTCILVCWDLKVLFPQVVGKNRFPCLDDRDKMPYVNAVLVIM